VHRLTTEPSHVLTEDCGLK